MLWDVGDCLAIDVEILSNASNSIPVKSNGGPHLKFRCEGVRNLIDSRDQRLISINPDSSLFPSPESLERVFIWIKLTRAWTL